MPQHARIAMLLDELLRRGVPLKLLQPIIDWMDDQNPHLRGQLGR